MYLTKNTVKTVVIYSLLYYYSKIVKYYYNLKQLFSIWIYFKM